MQPTPPPKRTQLRTSTADASPNGSARAAIDRAVRLCTPPNGSRPPITRRPQSEGSTGAPSSVPSGGARAAVQFCKNAECSHDVEFYQAVAQELPESSVVHSILYTFRSVIDSSQSCDEILHDVDAHVSGWRAARQSAIEEMQRSNEEARTLQSREQQEEEVIRSAEQSRAMQRIEATFVDLDNRISKSAEEQEAGLEEAWAAMRKRHETEMERTLRGCKKIDDNETAAKERMRDIELSTQLSKVYIASTAERNSLLTEEERARIELAFARARERQRLFLLEERKKQYAALQQEERTAFEYMHSWARQLNERCARATRLRELLASTLVTLQQAEKGLRQNVELDEKKEVQDILAAKGGAAE